MRWALWLGWRFFKSPNQRWNATSVMSLVGIMIGVASLVVAMAVMSGFGKTLRSAVIDSSGDLVVIQRGQNFSRWRDIESELKRISPEIQAASPYLMLESVATHAGKISGVGVQGMDPEGIAQVLNLENRLIDGKLDLSQSGEFYGAAVGKGLASKLSLKVGDNFRVVYPQPHPYDSNRMERRLLSLRVTGILSLGKYEYDERMILTPIGALQQLIDNENAFTGVIVKVEDSLEAPAIADRLSAELGQGYYVRDWQEINQYLFEAVDVEKMIIFFVLLIIVLAAAVNVAISINVNVIQRYSDIAVLKAMGVTAKQVWRILSLQGLVIGIAGLAGGYSLGVILSLVVEWLQNSLIRIPQETYKIDRIYVELRWEDALAIAVATLIICFLSAAWPARRGARLKPVEGLRYE